MKNSKILSLSAVALILGGFMFSSLTNAASGSFRMDGDRSVCNKDLRSIFNATILGDDTDDGSNQINLSSTSNFDKLKRGIAEGCNLTVTLGMLSGENETKTYQCLSAVSSGGNNFRCFSLGRLDETDADSISDLHEPTITISEVVDDTVLLPPGSAPKVTVSMTGFSVSTGRFGRGELLFNLPNGSRSQLNIFAKK